MSVLQSSRMTGDGDLRALPSSNGSNRNVDVGLHDYPILDGQHTSLS